MAEVLATMFGIGRVPYAPGTAASIVALPLAWVVLMLFGSVWVLVLSVIVAAIGIWACDVYAHEADQDDPSECVIDELAGQLLACAWAPLSIPGFLVALVLFRLFDISKLGPIGAVERLGGGWGIVGDDMVAGLFAGAIVGVLANVGIL